MTVPVGSGGLTAGEHNAISHKKHEADDGTITQKQSTGPRALDTALATSR